MPPVHQDRRRPAGAAGGLARLLAPGPLDELPVIANPFGLQHEAAILDVAVYVGMLVFALTTCPSTW